MKINFSILLICLFILSCKKDPPVSTIVNNDVDCLNLHLTNITAYLNWPDVDTVYNTPRFNPINSNEIIYVQGIVSTGKAYLVKLNLSTGQETQVIDNVWQRPDWSIKDWIVFNHADNQVWKIKSNGDSLTLITKNFEGGFNAVWSPDGNKLAYIPAQYPKTLITDAKGNYLDSLSNFAHYLSRWSNDGNYICAIAFDNINVIYQDVYTGQKFQPTQNNKFNPIAWIDFTADNKFIIWANSTGLYKTNIITSETIKLKNTCNLSYYTSVTVSHDGNKIIAQRIDNKVENNVLYTKSGFSLFDIDCKNEVIIK